MGTGKLRNNGPSAGKGRSWRWLGLWLALLLGRSGVAGAAPDRADGALGPYGFLSSAVLGPQPDAEARARVRIMARDYGIREFLFYDWFASYSTPVRGAEWPEPFAGRGKISRRSVEVSVDEIHRHGGRAWAYVQAVAAEERGVGEPLVDAGGRWYWHPPAVCDVHAQRAAGAVAGGALGTRRQSAGV
jgi:hypothetical protein